MEQLVSIITPLYNSAKFIEGTIISVKKQNYKNWEMLIVDDCSIDRGPEIARYYMEMDKRIKLITIEKNSGPVIARNRGIQEANGKYIAFLDSDDLWYPNKLMKQINLMESNNVNFTFTCYERIDEDGNKLNQYIRCPTKIAYKDLLKTNYIGCLTAVYNQEALGKIFMPDIKKRQDYGTWLEVLKKENYAYCIDENLAMYRIRKNSISNKKLDLVKYNWKLFRECEHLSFISSVYYLGCNIYNKLFNRYLITNLKK